MINKEYLIKLISKNIRKDEILNPFSTILKKQRLNKNYTLEETSYGICSVSYLCKLENGLIEPREEYVERLFEKLDLNYQDFSAFEDNNLLDDTFNAYYHNDYQKVREIVGGIENIYYDNDINLCKAMLFIVNGDLDSARVFLDSVDSLKNNLDSRSAFVYALIYGEVLIREHRYHDALDYLLPFENSKASNKYFNNLLLENIIISSFHMNDYLRVCAEYEKLNIEYQIGYSNRRKIILLLIKKIVLGLKNEDVSNDLLTFVNNNNYLNSDYDIYYLSLLGLAKLKKYNEVITIIEKDGLFSRSDILALYGYCIYKLDDKSKYLSFMELSNEVIKESDNDQNYKFIEFLNMIFINSDKIKFYDRLKFDIIPFSCVFQHNLYNEVYRDVYIELLESFSKYKDSTIFLKESIG